MIERARKTAAERRHEIVNSALRIIGGKGFGALTTAALAEAVGVSSGAIFRHFSSLDAVLGETVRYAVDRLEATFPPDDLPPLDRLLILVRHRVGLLRGDAGLAWLLRSDQAFAALPAAAVEMLRAVAKRSTRCLLKAIQEGAAQGSVRDDVAPEMLLVIVIGAIHALVGVPGVHRLASPGRRQGLDPALDALRRMLASPGGTACGKVQTK